MDELTIDLELEIELQKPGLVTTRYINVSIEANGYVSVDGEMTPRGPCLYTYSGLNSLQVWSSTNQNITEELRTRFPKTYEDIEYQALEEIKEVYL